MKDELDPVNPNELIIRILKKIQSEAQATREDLKATREDLRAEIRALGARVDETHVRIDETNDRIDALGEHLGARIGAVELTLVDLATQQGTTVSVLRELRQRVSVLEAGSG